MNKLRFFNLISSLLFVFALTLGNNCLVSAQDKEQKIRLNSESKQAREFSLNILSEMESILTKYYYDSGYHGIDLKSRIETAKTRIKTLQYNWQMYRVLVQVLMDLDDSHTRMLLPPRTDHFAYGFGIQMIGNDCFITSVKNDSDAHKQGIEIGDQVTLLGKYNPTRSDLWKMEYVLFKLDPSDSLDLKIRKPDGTERTLNIKAKVMTDKQFRAEIKARKEKPKYEPFKCREINKEVIACKLYSFVVDRDIVDKMMKQAAKYPKFILDLRGNGGGYITVEQHLLSYFFDKEIKIADLVSREKKETQTTKVMGDKQYKGEVAVLIDSDSASASEITARVLQMHNRAKIYGDVSSGSVMTSYLLPFKSVINVFMDAAIIQVGMNVTVADVLMSDGSRLEKKGVIPDQVLQPTGLGLSKKTDPVLAYAALKLGAEISPETAGSYYFIVEKDEDAGEDNDQKQ